MKSKSFVLSKINWLGVVLIIQGLLGSNEVGELLRAIAGPDLAAVILERGLALVGALLIILRTFFTSKPVTEYAARTSRSVPLSRFNLVLFMVALLQFGSLGCASRGVEGATQREKVLIEAAGSLAVAQEARADLNRAFAASVQAACAQPGEACERRKEIVRPIAQRLFQAGAILDRAEDYYERARNGEGSLSLALQAVTEAALVFAAVRGEAVAGGIPIPDRVDAAIASLGVR